jgi:glycosyltransferase involved in cell wall biosynthesis
MPEQKVLFISSGHPALSVGGTELYALDVYEAFRESDEFDPILLARAGSPLSVGKDPLTILDQARRKYDQLLGLADLSSDQTTPHLNSPFAMVEDDANQYLLYTDPSNFDNFFGAAHRKEMLVRSIQEFLLAHQPDVVHFQHTHFLGYDIVRVTRQTLPDVPIVYSLHEYLPICQREGQMVRTKNDELCMEESPRRCNECFPELTPQMFYLRKRFIQSHLALVDCFVAPSEYVRERYVEWGIPSEKIEVEPQGFSAMEAGSKEDSEDRPRNRFAYFGQLHPFKGADVLLQAMDVLGEDFDAHLWIFGANRDLHAPELRDRFEPLLSSARENVTFVGEYDRADLGRLMASIDWVVVPSIWWETGPLTVLEAFECGRPVICSDIGGMSEKVTDGVNGLHFRRGDADELAEVMLRAAETPGLWEKLHSGIPERPPRTMEEHVEALSGIYRRLLAERREASVGQRRLERVLDA